MFTKQCIVNIVYKTMYTKPDIQNMYTIHAFKTCIQNLNTKQCIEKMYTKHCIQYNVYKTL